ncbi:hypothetical protein [Brevundimonas sp. TWP2-3-4b1]|uniref:hypothetical protein n=1 Tax=unclassified Brevundimonas TaxID=2622653 RepID=UPI003CF73512
MVIKRELSRIGDRLLTEIRSIGVDGQVCSTSYEIDGPEKLSFSDRAEAEAAMRADASNAAVLTPD